MDRSSARLRLLLALLIGAGAPPSASACDQCGCSFNAKRSDQQSAGGSLVTTPTANTLGKGRGTVSVLFEQQRFNRIPAGDAHSLHHRGHEVHGKDHEEFYNIGLGYGLLDNLDVFVITPIVSKTSIEVEDHAMLGEKDTATGMGDLQLVGKYRFWREGLDAALLVGVNAPAGDTSERKPSGEKFGPEQQPGSGSWDATVGLAASRRVVTRVTLANAFRYTTRGEGAQEEKLGDVFHYDLGASYALRPLGAHPNLSLTLELHNEWALRDHSREQEKVGDSGGTTTLLSPGLSADLTDSLAAFWAMPIPVYQNLGGQHEELVYEIITGMNWHF